MTNQQSKPGHLYHHLALSIALVAGAQLTSTAVRAENTRIVELTQTGCQFLESETRDQGYQPGSAKDCETINAQSADKRLAEAQPLRLKPGKVIFRVTNADVPYPLGFWVRGKGLQRVSLPSTSGGGLTAGVTKDYEITLEEGTYYYSCPLNPTPDYLLIVEG